MDLYFLLTALPIFDKVFLFVETGGVVLIPLIILAFLMALLITEKFLCVFLKKNQPNITDKKNTAIPYTTKASYYRKRIEINKYLATKAKDHHNKKNINLIKQLIVIAPLLGLLGTVTGMIEVFEVIKIHGSENTVLIGRGFSHATIPTMFGLTVAIFGFLSLAILEGAVKKHEIK